MLLFGLAEFACLVGLAVSIIGIIIKGIKKQPGKKKWGLVTLISFVILVILAANTPESVYKNKQDKIDSQQSVQETVAKDAESAKENTKTEESQKPEASVQETVEVEKSDVEKFAEKYGVSIELATSINDVLSDMELTDKSRVGVFHYTIADVKSWKKVEDWAEGERYSGYMAEEHIWYFYIKDDAIVGVRDGNGNVYYTQE